MKKIIFGLCVVALSIASWSGAEEETVSMIEQYKNECKRDLEQVEKLFLQVENATGPYTEETILEPMNTLGIVMGNSARKAGLYFNTHPESKIRDVAKQHRQDLSSLGSKIYMSVPICNALKQVEAPKDEQSARLLKEMLRDYRRSGVDQPEEIREQIKTLIEELTVLGQNFSENISTDVRFIDLDSVDELDGLPEDYIAAHKPGENGKIRITTNYPDYVPFMRFAKSNEARHALYMVYQNRAYPANKQVLKDILIKRHKMAQLLGYANYAEYTAETRMIKTAGNIQTFIDKVANIARPRAEREYDVLLKRLQKMEPESKTVDPWNAGFVSEIVRREKYEVDAKVVRTYFQFGHVRDGILEMTSKMFGVTFRRWNTPVWHEDVVAYEMVEDGNVIGRFYFDLFPRDNKFKHAAHFSMLDGIKGRQVPTSALVCNFPGKGDESALMEHSQVETFLHEFGHMLHHLFAGEQRWTQFSGIATERDFVEAPSQMLEEWVWNAEALRMISLNQSGETLPDELLIKMVAAKEFGRGLTVCGQMNYAALSLNYYDCDPTDLDLDKTMIDLSKKYSIYDHVPETHTYAGFGHLYGYSAGYYTYMWSLVISKDLLSRFELEGMLNPNVAKAYRRAILAPGGSRDAADMVEDFLGRPYSFEPFGSWLNTQK